MVKIPSPRVYPAFLIAIIGICSAGCSGSNKPTMIPVRGRITLEKGEWPKSGQIFFSPVKTAAGLPAKPNFAIFSKDGSFVVKTGDYEGLIPGEYHISIYCNEKSPSETASGVSCIPKKFSNPTESGLTLTIEPEVSGPVIWNHDFPRNKQ
jgi:hypothetical protein